MRRFLFLLYSLSVLAAFAPVQATACGKGCMKKEKREQTTQACCCAQQNAPPDHCGSNSRDCDDHCHGHCACPVMHSGAFLTTGETLFIPFEPAWSQSFFTYQAPCTSGTRPGVWLPPNFGA